MCRLAFLAALVALGCSADLTSGISADGVVISASVGGRSELGDSIHVHIANTGIDTAYLPRCGSGPLLLSQQFVDGAWIGGVQNFACVAPTEPGPVTLPPGGSVDAVRFFSSGRYRMLVSVARRVDLSDVARALSNAFDAP